MKKLGIIGGAGPLASALFYETLISESYARRKEVPEIFLINYPFTRGMSLDERKDNEDIIINELAYCIKVLVQNGAEMAVLVCNTLHLFLKKLSNESLQFHSLPETVITAARERNHRCLLVLGTENTCHSHLYKLAGTHVEYPSLKNQKLIAKVIDHVLEGKILESDSHLITEIIQQTFIEFAYVEFDGVILGCTELPVLHHHYPIASAKTIYDSIKIPAKTVVGIL